MEANLNDNCIYSLRPTDPCWDNPSDRMVDGGKEMMCIWCGSTGGSINRLIVYLDGESNGVIECEWCSMKKSIEASKSAIKAMQEERE